MCEMLKCYVCKSVKYISCNKSCWTKEKITYCDSCSKEVERRELHEKYRLKENWKRHVIEKTKDCVFIITKCEFCKPISKNDTPHRIIKEQSKNKENDGIIMEKKATCMICDRSKIVK